MAFEAVPQELRENAKWCCWGYRDKDGRRTKIPFNPHTGGKAKSNDPTTFGTFAEAEAALKRGGKKYDGLGVGLFGNLVGIDIDHCCTDGELSPVARKVVSLVGSYAELSPSGTGVHIYCTADGFEIDRERYYIKNPRNGVEFYAAGSTNRFLTVTGVPLNTEGLNVRSTELDDILELYMQRPRKTAADTASAMSTESTEDPEDDDPISADLDDTIVLDRMWRSEKGSTLKRLWDGDWQQGYKSQSEADQALCNHLAFWTRKNVTQMDRLFRKSGLMRDKWDEQRGAETYGQKTLRNAVSDCTEVWIPGYRSIEPGGQQAALDFLTREDVIHNRRYTHDDVGAGYLLADFLKPFARPVPERKSWRVYDGRRWKNDVGGKTVESFAKDMSRALATYAATLEDKDMQEYLSWAARWAKQTNRKTYLYEATSVWPVSEGDFDNDPWLLNLNNGTLDLRTLKLHDHNPDDLITQFAPVDYNPAAVCPRWGSFIREVTEPGSAECGNDKATVWGEKAAFLQTFLGYCLSGDTSAEAFLVLYGATSRNGKSVLCESVQAVLGDYSRTMAADSLMTAKFRDGSRPSEDIARLAGSRMVSVGEIQQGSKLDASRVKTLTGGDTVNARFLGENSFEFTPHFKLLLHTNHLPQCSDLSVFDSGRALVLPFSRHFEEHEQDRNLKKLFREPANQSGILNWLIQGLREYREHGLHAPAAVKAATAEYRRDSDKVAQFTEDRLHRKPDAAVRLTLVYSAYKLWCVDSGCYPESISVFKRKLLTTGLLIEKRRPSSTEGATPMIVGYELTSDLDDLRPAM